MVAEELYVEELSGKTTICVRGECDLGYISFNVPLTNALAGEVVEKYLKRVNRLKTLLEVAAKLEGDE
jgi:hypothetical protein